MNSLSLGVWGSFTTPRSRALGGKSGMTRAAPLVFGLPRRADLCLPHILFELACLVVCIALASMPPPDRPYLPPFVQEQPCLDDPTDLIPDLITGWKLSGARAAAQFYAERSERVACADVRAPPR